MNSVSNGTTARTDEPSIAGRIREAKRASQEQADRMREQIAWLAKLLLQQDDQTLDDHETNDLRLQALKMLAMTIDGDDSVAGSLQSALDELARPAAPMPMHADAAAEE